MPKKVIVAMSGGVDSSVAAALLKKQGFNVVGVFMKFWSAPSAGKTRWNKCCSSEAEKRAREVARALHVPFYVFNFSREFKKRIVDCFLAEYRAGRTPNPCIVCNKEIKFGLLLERALALGADYLATGHYIKVKDGRLFRAKDNNKDQSYFLWKLNQRQLKHVLSPVGGYAKQEVRALAKKFKLSVAETPESQEICFVPTNINDFLGKYLKTKSGPIICLTPDVKNRKHRVLGGHGGLAFYTIGQRKGIGLSGGPYWVVGKDLKKNILFITKNEKDLSKKELFFRDINWLSSKPPKLPLKVKAKIRYRSKLATATVYKNNKVVFDQPQRAITPGQSVVFYKNNEVLGGGIIS